MLSKETSYSQFKMLICWSIMFKYHFFNIYNLHTCNCISVKKEYRHKQTCILFQFMTTAKAIVHFKMEE